jgi:hypothetical protein
MYAVARVGRKLAVHAHDLDVRPRRGGAHVGDGSLQAGDDPLREIAGVHRARRARLASSTCSGCSRPRSTGGAVSSRATGQGAASLALPNTRQGPPGPRPLRHRPHQRPDRGLQQQGEGSEKLRAPPRAPHWRGPLLRRAQGRASRIRLKGVSVARRKREKPPCVTTTSRSRASPACAPSAGPSCAREWGTHSIVDAE